MRPVPSYRQREWTSGPRENLTQTWRYSVFVKVMKGAFPLAALALAAAVLVYALSPRDSRRVALTFERLKTVQGDLAMEKPRLTGVDDNGKPFVVTAKSAVQDGRGSDNVRLEGVVAEIDTKDGTLHVTAEKGLVNTKTYHLDISGVRLTSEDGYEARTAAASADLKEGKVHGESPIEAEGKFGRLTARGFSLDRDARKLQFSGNVRMLLRPREDTPLRRNSP